MSKPLVPVRSSALDRRRSQLEGPNHTSLHGSVIRAVVGSAVGAFAADLLCRLMGLSGVSSKLFAILVAAGALAGIALRSRRWVAGFFGGGLGAVGSLASSLTAQWAPFSAALFGLAATPVLGAQETPKRKLLTAVVAGAFGYAGLNVAQVLLQAGWLTALVPGPLAVASAGAVAGLFIGLATAPRYLLPAPHSVEVAFEPALNIRDGEIHDLLARALEIHRTVRVELCENPQNLQGHQLEKQVSEHVMRILQIAEHCRRMGDDLAPGASTQLEDRVSELEAKMGATTDVSAKETYAQALSSLREQQTAVRRLEDGRERVVAKLHVSVAQLEKLRLSLLQLGAADAERFGAEISPVSEALEELGRELDATAHAISEVFGSSHHFELPPPTPSDTQPS